MSERIAGGSEGSQRDWLGEGRRLARTRFVWLAFALAIVCALITARALRAGAFRDDDFVNIGLRQDAGLGMTTFFATPELRDHLNPAAGGLSWLIGALGPEWWMAQWFAALLVGLIVVLGALVVRELTESPIVALGAASMLGTSSVVVSTAGWWTTASSGLTMIAAALATILLALRWRRSRATKWLVLSWLLQLLACAFSDRAVIIPLLVWVLLVLPPSSDAPTVRRLLDRTRSALPLLAGLFAIAISQVVLTVLLAKANTSGGLSYFANAPVGTWVEVALNWWGRGVSATVINDFSGPTEGQDLVGIKPQWGFSLAGGLLLIGALLIGTVRNRSSAMIWLAFILLTTISGLQIAAGRLEVLGVEGIAAISRYQDLSLLFGVLLIPTAWAASGRPLPRRRWALGLLAGLAAVFAVVWLANLRSSVQGTQARIIAVASYSANLRNSISELSRNRSSLTVLDGHLPGFVVFQVPTTAGYNRIEKAARVISPNAKLPEVNLPSGTLWQADGTGALRPVRIGPQRQLSSTGRPCGRSAAQSSWLGPGSYAAQFPMAAPILNSMKTIMVSVELENSSSRGVIALTSSTEPLPLYVYEIASYPSGFRAVIPALSSSVTIGFWGGGGGCIKVKAAEVLSP